MSTTKSTCSIQPYLFFNGRCDEALEFYRKALNAEATAVIRYKDSPVPVKDQNPDKVMHANFRVGETQIMASDGMSSEGGQFQGFALTLNVPTEADADRFFSALAEGGQVQMPLAKTFYSPRFGMVTDRFGILWMILTAADKTGAKQ